MHQESNIQQACVTWFRYQYQHLQGLLFAVPNGGFRTRLNAVTLQREGVVPGVSDMILLVPSGEFHALCIEMKAGKNKQSALQKEWQRKAESVGNKYVVCYSLEQFINEVTNYLNDKNDDD